MFYNRDKEHILSLDRFQAHQEDDVGVLIKSSGHTDSLSLSSAQVDALNHIRMLNQTLTYQGSFDVNKTLNKK